jgi:hypothetical protein
MSGLLRRLTRRRAATADETRPETPASEPVDAPPPAPAPGSGDQPVPTDEQPTAAHDLPAGVDPDELGMAPGEGARRGGVRRRARYLRAVREVLLRDLGGFSYELHRTAGGTPDDDHRRLLEAKAARLTAIDAELRELEARLGQAHREAVLRTPGLGGTCPECGELHGSEAAFCWRCGAALTERATRRRTAAATAPRTGGHIAAPAATEPGGATAARLALWMKSGKPAPAEPASAEPAPKPPAPASSTATPAAAPEPAAPAPGAEPPADEPASKRPAKPRKKAAEAEPGPPDQQPTAVDRPSDRPGTLSDGDPLASPAERGS